MIELEDDVKFKSMYGLSNKMEITEERITELKVGIEIMQFKEQKVKRICC